MCQPLPLSETWLRHELNLSVPSWLPATVSAAFVVTGAPATVWLDDVELRMLDSGTSATTVTTGASSSAPPSPLCKTLNILLQEPPTDAIWAAGQQLQLVVRAAESCATMGLQPAASVTVQHQLLTPNGVCLATGARTVTTLRAGNSTVYSLRIPANTSGGILLNMTAQYSGGAVVSSFTYRLLVGQPPTAQPLALAAHVPNNSSESLDLPFAFCSTIEWHVQAALLGSGLLARQLRAEQALGINCHHVYLDSPRMRQMLQQPFAAAVAKQTKAHNITFLFTLLPNHILQGECGGQPGAPCTTTAPFATSSFCRAAVARLVPKSVPQPRPGKVTPASLERVCELTLRLATAFGPYVKYWALEGEPQSNGLAVGEYALRVLPVLSTAVRAGAGPAAVLLGGGIVNGFRDLMWNNTLSERASTFFDAFAFHPYRFDRLDPEACVVPYLRTSCCGPRCTGYSVSAVH